MLRGNLSFDVAHLLAGSLVLVSFMQLYQDRLYALLNVYALHALVLAASACSGATIKPTATNLTVPPPPADGITMTAAGWTLVVPKGLATSGIAKAILASKPGDNPAVQPNPAYTQITLEGYSLQGKFFEPTIAFYPAAEYAQLSEGASQAMTELKAVLADPGSKPDHMPFLPGFNASQLFYSQFKIISFPGGTGIRYLTQYDQAPLPVNNNELFYTFQGLTADGRNYVSIIFPASHPSLPASPDALTLSELEKPMEDPSRKRQWLQVGPVLGNVHLAWCPSPCHRNVRVTDGDADANYPNLTASTTTMMTTRD